MSVLEPYYKKQAKLVSHLADAVAQIPEDKLGWKPCERALPWLGLIDHTAVGRRHVTLACIKDEKVDFPGVFHRKELYAKSPAEAAEHQHETWAELEAFLKSQPDDFSKKIVTFPSGHDLSVERILWMIYEENVHHRGQAWVYARMNGIKPPSIWGSEPDWR